MKWKPVTLSCAAIFALSPTLYLYAASQSADAGLSVDITNPRGGDVLRWGTQSGYSVTVAYDGKSTKYGEIPANYVLMRASYAANLDAARARRKDALPDALIDITRSNCTGCHDFSASAAGPSFSAIARRYAGKAAAASKLVSHIKNGSSGIWSEGVMPPHPDLSEAQATAIAKWIVGHGNDPAIHYYVGPDGGFRMEAPTDPGPKAGMVLRAFYTGPLNDGDMRVAAGNDVVVVRGSPGP